MLVLAVAGAACTAEPRQPSPTEPPIVTTTTVPATTTTTLPLEQAIETFRNCMTANGVTIAEIPVDSEGRPRLEIALADVDFSDSAATEALTLCAEHLAAGALDLSAWPALQDEVQAKLSEFSECVRSHGVEAFPDPVRAFSGVGGPFPLDEIPYDDPDLAEAVETCRSRLTGEQS
jgi:hypothetical protein